MINPFLVLVYTPKFCREGNTSSYIVSPLWNNYFLTTRMRYKCLSVPDLFLFKYYCLTNESGGMEYLIVILDISSCLLELFYELYDAQCPMKYFCIKNVHSAVYVYIAVGCRGRDSEIYKEFLWLTYNRLDIHKSFKWGKCAWNEVWYRQL